MDDPSITDRIITELKQLKMQGRTYAQASDVLKERGYIEAQIAEAANRFNYDTQVTYDMDENGEYKVSPPPKPIATMPKPASRKEAVNAHQVVAKPVRNHKPLNLRPLAYVIVAIPAAYLGALIYRLWLHLQYLSSVYNPRYELAHNLVYYYLSGGIGVAIAIMALKFFYRWIDMPDQQQRSPHNGGTDTHKPA